MKKILKVMALMLITSLGTSVFAQNKIADNIELSLSISPYSLESFNYKSSSIDTINTKYGFGAEIEGRYFFNEILYTGLDLSFDDFYLGSSYSKNYFNAKVMPEIGARFNLNEKFYLFTALGAGAFIGYYDGTAGCYFGSQLSLGGGFNLTQKIGIELGAAGNWHLQNHSDSDLTANVFGLNTKLGVKFRF